ncbi:hypothetical protein Metok_0475 [Methanothermococcus okinawensis IH1]|uniref:Uncharacterized protein n=1 Tax=Methanothermococcus okinawensis (strain DSM 14208 / JCM 11175 / IH1) TaxID=647113 RepID=F8AL21_METOI|nr:hypothetical protein Metok_0475 [Methanothermococcus okinawensis IH1]
MKDKKYSNYRLIWCILFGILLILMYNIGAPYKLFINGLLFIMIFIDITLLFIKFFLKNK